MSDTKELRDKWLEALCNKEYKQGQQYLHSVDSKGNERFCCMGVLCDVWMKNSPKCQISWSTDTIFWSQSAVFNHIFSFGEHKYFPPGIIFDDIGLSPNYRTVLAQMNDCGFNTFEQIADYLEGVFNEQPV